MNILFVDDEQRRMRPVVEEFIACGHEVLFQSDIDEALQRIRGPQNFDLIVMDISMPSGKEFQNDDTDGGARTGIALYNTVRTIRPNQKIVIYTNVSDSAVADRFAKEDQRLCRFVRKPEIFPFEFVAEMERFVGG